MIIGTINVTDDAVITHRDSYLLNYLTVISVRRPVLVPSAMLALSGAAFGMAFSDLLFPTEIIGIGVFVSVASFIGFQVGQLKLVSRDLKNTELSSAIWGQYHALQNHRHKIVDGVRRSKHEEVQS
jgi:hypothetical protein